MDKIRFESLIETVRRFLDKDLKILEFYDECDKPIIQHFFLADMIRKGHHVITINFDSLIEQALYKLGINKNNILPIITEEDYNKYRDLESLFDQGKMALVKIHGSIKNFNTGNYTKDSLIATIKDLGENKSGMNIFQIENFNYPIVNKILNNHTLVVLGYSKVLRHVFKLFFWHLHNLSSSKFLTYH